ncbi:MAG: hypothetical protein HDR92_08260 [Bacteroides sp.]|nr:hypothetical protein [Bacteroides sp.]
MNNDSLIIKNLPASIDILETTAEGQLRGGFAVMGGSSASPMRTNDLCFNIECYNNGCSEYIGENKKCWNTGCNETTINSYFCSNHECVSEPSGNTDSSVPTLGITSLF